MVGHARSFRRAFGEPVAGSYDAAAAAAATTSLPPSAPHLRIDQSTYPSHHTYPLAYLLTDLRTDLYQCDSQRATELLHAKKIPWRGAHNSPPGDYGKGRQITIMFGSTVKAEADEWWITPKVRQSGSPTDLQP